MPRLAALFLFSLLAGSIQAAEPLTLGEFHWTVGPPLLSAAVRPDDPCYSVKDPSVIYFGGQWRLFSTIRSVKRTHQIEYVSFADWKNAAAAPRQILALTNNYFCAPQVFYFTPHRKWYLIYQASELTREPSLQPAFSTTTDLADPFSWTKPVFLFKKHPANIKAWIDFWVICDDAKAHLFFTSNNGLMWRAETALQDFPFGWNEPRVVLRDDIFEASHTYHLKGHKKFLTIVEAEARGRRYYKAYTAGQLDGEWLPLAATKEKPFASPVNVRDTAVHWTDSFSHGELLRDGYDEHLEVDPEKLRFLFQGVADSEGEGKPYGQIPWKLGLLELALPVF